MHPRIRRRIFLYLGLGTIVTAFVRREKSAVQSAQAVSCRVTPSQTMGPFYPEAEQPEKDFDLTQLEGHSQRAEGDLIYIRGQVLDETCNPIAGAVVEIWQANQWGRYSHSRDQNTAPLDPNFQGWGQVVTDAQGRYGFKTILPGAYRLSANADSMRPPHIHFKVSRQGYQELVTQMYFAGQSLNDSDRILSALSESERSQVIVALTDALPEMEPDAKVGQFNLGLRQSSVR